MFALCVLLCLVSFSYKFQQKKKSKNQQERAREIKRQICQNSSLRQPETKPERERESSLTFFFFHISFQSDFRIFGSNFFFKLFTLLISKTKKRKKKLKKIDKNKNYQRERERKKKFHLLHRLCRPKKKMPQRIWNEKNLSICRDKFSIQFSPSPIISILDF